MNLREHLLWTLLLFVFYPVFGSLIILSVLWGVIIDIDHIWLVIHQKAYSRNKIKWLLDNIQQIYKVQGHERFKGTVYLFHTVEFNVILIAAAFVYPFLWFIVIGSVFHIILDIIAHWPYIRWLFIYSSVK